MSSGVINVNPELLERASVQIGAANAEIEARIAGVKATEGHLAGEAKRIRDAQTVITESLGQVTSHKSLIQGQLDAIRATIAELTGSWTGQAASGFAAHSSSLQSSAHNANAALEAWIASANAMNEGLLALAEKQTQMNAALQEWSTHAQAISTALGLAGRSVNETKAMFVDVDVARGGA